MYIEYLYNISSRCSGCTLHTGFGHCRVHGWRGELLLVHACVGDLGTMWPLDHGLGGPRGHRLGLRVSTQRGHDGRGDGDRRGVVLLNLLNDDKYILLKTCSIFAVLLGLSVALFTQRLHNITATKTLFSLFIHSQCRNAIITSHHCVTSDSMPTFPNQKRRDE